MIQHRVLDRLDDFGAIRFVRIREDRIRQRRLRRRIGRGRRGRSDGAARARHRGCRDARQRDRSHLQLETLERLLEARVALLLHVLLERGDGALQPEIVLIERPQAPDERGELERGNGDVEEHAVAFEPEAARVRVVGDELIGGHLHQLLEPIADDRDAVLHRAFDDALHLADLIARLSRVRFRPRARRRRLRGKRRRNRHDETTCYHRCKPIHGLPLLSL